MKEITRIHLAATPFNAEVRAKKELESYLGAVEKSLQADDDAMREIEARIVELLAERSVTGEKVITADDVASIKAKLGAPGEFIDEHEAEGAVATAHEKRLMRDQERGILGGVLAGISAYAGIDPIWLRLLAVVLAFVSLGTVLLVYAVLWIAMPAAKTAAEKLQMRGKPVTLESIKNQSQIVTIGNESRKSAVIVLRIILGLLFSMVAAGALAATVGALLAVGIRIDDVPMSFLSAWILVGFALAVVSGLLFAALNSLLAYASFAWRFPRRMAVSIIAIIIAGIVSFTAAVGAGLYGTGQLDRQLKDMTHIEKVDLSSDLTGINNIVSVNKNVPIEYRVTNQVPRAEIKVVSDSGKVPKMSVKRTGDTAELSIQDIKDPSCDEGGWHRLCLDDVSVVIYGPALAGVEAREGRIEYWPTSQSTLDVVSNASTSVLLAGGSVEKVNAKVADQGSFDAARSSVREAKIEARSNASIAMGVVASFDFSAPESCPANSKTEITIARVATLRVNGRSMAQAVEINDSCVRVGIDEPQSQMLN